MKRCGGSPPTSSSPAPAGGGSSNLPAELWARVMDYSYFDDVMALTAVSKVFRDDVPPHMKRLLVGSGESMDVMPAAIERFCSVEEVLVYSFVPDTFPDDDDGLLREDFLDSATVNNVIPFISKLPALKTCTLGGLSNWGGLNDRMTLACQASNDFYVSPDLKVKNARLIEVACQAYVSGELSERVLINGLLPVQRKPIIGTRDCAWMDMPKLEYREDVRCQVCDMVCHSFPPLRVVDQLENSTVPCISLVDRLRIAQFRDRKRFGSNLTEKVLQELLRVRGKPVMVPPTYSEKRYAMFNDELRFQKMKILLDMGADARDPRIGKELTAPERKSYSCNDKRVLLPEAYGILKNDLGLDVNKDDFVIIDETDSRTSYSLFRIRKEKEELDAEYVQECMQKFASKLKTLNVDIEEVQLRVNDFVHNIPIAEIDPYPDLSTSGRVHSHLAGWLGTDLLYHSEATHVMFLEAASLL